MLCTSGFVDDVMSREQWARIKDVLFRRSSPGGGSLQVGRQIKIEFILRICVTLGSPEKLLNLSKCRLRHRDSAVNHDGVHMANTNERAMLSSVATITVATCYCS